jgi:hypothetical protein
VCRVVRCGSEDHRRLISGTPTRGGDPIHKELFQFPECEWGRDVSLERCLDSRSAHLILDAHLLRGAYFSARVNLCERMGLVSAHRLVRLSSRRSVQLNIMGKQNRRLRDMQAAVLYEEVRR